MLSMGKEGEVGRSWGSSPCTLFKREKELDYRIVVLFLFCLSKTRQSCPGHAPWRCSPRDCVALALLFETSKVNPHVPQVCFLQSSRLDFCNPHRASLIGCYGYRLLLVFTSVNLAGACRAPGVVWDHASQHLCGTASERGPAFWHPLWSFVVKEDMVDLRKNMSAYK